MHLRGMPRLRPFTALRFVTEGPARVSWAVGPGRERAASAAGAAWVHAGALLGSADPSALVKTWSTQGELVMETEGLYVVETAPLSPRPGRSGAPARFLVGVMEPDDDVLTPFEQQAPEATLAMAQCVPVLAADDQHSLEEAMSAIARLPPRDAWVSEGFTVRLWKVDEPGQWRRLEDVLSEMILRPLWSLPAGRRALAAIAPVFDEAVDLRPIHRGLTHLPTFNAERFLAVVKDYARVYEVEAPLTTSQGLEAARERMAALASRSHAVLLVLPGGQGRILRFRQDLDLAHLKAAPRSPTLRSLDLALLESVVLQTVLGLREPQAPVHGNLFSVASAPRVVDQVNSSVFQAGFVLNPPPRWELRAVMEAAQSLPPRTLYLEGGPPVGLLFLAPE